MDGHGNYTNFREKLEAAGMVTDILINDINIVEEIKCQLESQAWWQTTLVPELERQRQSEFCEFEANLVYKFPSHLGLQGDLVLLKKCQ